MARKSRYINESQTYKKESIFKVGIYARLSIEDDDNEEQNSIGNQRKIILDYLKDKTDMIATEFYTDNGFTGMNFNRPDFQKMMSDIRSNKINCVIVKDISRFGRHFVMTSEYVEKIFPLLGTRLICVNDDYDSQDELCDTSALLMPIKMVMNDSYARDISIKIRSSIKSKMNSGEFLPASVSIPYGYKRNIEAKTYDIDEETASVVVRIFKMKEDGMAINAICKELNQEGIPCPSKLRYIRGNSKNSKFNDSIWIRATVRKILRDPVYIGYRIHGKVKRDKIGLPKKKRDKNEWQIIKDAHSAIISKEQFDRVQKIMDDTLAKRSIYKQYDNPEIDFREVLREKVYCGDCRSLMRACKGLSRADKFGIKKSHIYYECGKFIDSSRVVCESHYVREDTIIESLQHELNRQIQLTINFEKMVDEIQNLQKVRNYNVGITNKLNSIQTKIRNKEHQMEQLFIDLTEGVIDKEEYAYAKQRYNEHYQKLLEEENKLIVSSKKLENIIYSSYDWIDKLKEHMSFSKINRSVIESFVDKIIVYPDKHVQILFKYQDPFKEVLDYVNQIPEVYRNE